MHVETKVKSLDESIERYQQKFKEKKRVAKAKHNKEILELRKASRQKVEEEIISVVVTKKKRQDRLEVL